MEGHEAHRYQTAGAYLYDLDVRSIRTQHMNASDIDKVKEIQSSYQARPLSASLHQKPPQTPPKIDSPPIDNKTFEPQFWHYSNFLLQFCPTLLSETALRAKFSRIGITAAAPWPPSGMPDDVIQAIKAGGRDAQKQLDQDVLKLTTSIGLFGTPNRWQASTSSVLLEPWLTSAEIRQKKPSIPLT